MKKQQDKFNNMSGFQNGNNQQEEGSVKVKTKNASKPKDDTDFGEYVDFEDVDE